MPPVRLRPPNRFSTLSFPVFGLSWYGNPGNGDSIVAYCGGGGSAKTGVTNKIVVLLNGIDEIEISTGDDVGVAVQVFEHIASRTVWLLAAVGKTVQLYSLPSAELVATVNVGESCGNALGVQVAGEAFAVGCDNGDIIVYRLKLTSNSAEIKPVFQCLGHTKSVCSLQFCPRAPLLISSAKDGTARVWNQGGNCVSVLKCDVRVPGAPPPKSKRPIQVMVRGCAFGDLDGNVVYTVASAKRGTAFLARWTRVSESSYKVDDRLPIHEHPVSAMNISKDGGLLAMGGADGTVYLFDLSHWKVLRKFDAIHDLPVTCIGARPFPCQLQGEEVPMHAMSASADSKLAHLTLVKKVPKKPQPAGELPPAKGTDLGYILSIIWLMMLCYAAYLVVMETLVICVDNSNLNLQCFVDDVLVAPASREGVSRPPF